MATYTELRGLATDSDLKNKIEVAVIVAAQTIYEEDPATANHANRLIWAAAAFGNPSGEVDRIFWSVLATNKDLTVAQITGASDSAIQTNVDDVIDLFATG